MFELPADDIRNEAPEPETARARMLRHFTSMPARVTGTLICLFIIASTVDVNAAIHILARSSPLFILLGLFLQIPVTFCAICEWAALIDSPAGSFKRLAWAYLKGIAPSQMIPTGLAGDLVRIYEASSFVDAETAMASVAVSRISSCIALFVWGSFGALQVREQLGLFPVLACAGSAIVLTALCAMAFLSNRLLAALASWVKSLNAKVARQLVLFMQEMRAYRKQRLRLALSFLTSMTGWGFQFVAAACFAHATGVDVPLAYLAVGSALSLFASAVPFAVNGMGIREGILIGILTRSGLSSSHAAAVALLVSLQLLPFVLISVGMWLLLKRAESRSTVQPVS